MRIIAYVQASDPIEKCYTASMGLGRKAAPKRVAAWIWLTVSVSCGRVDCDPVGAPLDSVRMGDAGAFQGGDGPTRAPVVDSRVALVVDVLVA